MSAIIHLYRVWCVTEAKFVEEWAENEPADCPTNAAHTITASWASIAESRECIAVVTDPPMEAVEPGATVVVANGRPAIEVQTGVDGWGTIQAIWPHDNNSAALLRVTLKFALKTTGTGTVVRVAVRAKAEGAGDDSSESWADTQFLDVTVSHTTLGEVFEGTVDLDASGFNLGNAMALQYGREGSHTNDTLNQAVQFLGVSAGAC